MEIDEYLKEAICGKRCCVSAHHIDPGKEISPKTAQKFCRLVSCSPWGCNESDTTEWLNWTDSMVFVSVFLGWHPTAYLLVQIESFLGQCVKNHRPPAYIPPRAVTPAGPKSVQIGRWLDPTSPGEIFWNKCLLISGMTPLVSAIKMYLLPGALERRPLARVSAHNILIGGRLMCWESLLPAPPPSCFSKNVVK